MDAKGTLAGQLNEFHLVELVQAMDIEGSSGALELLNLDGRKGIIYFEHGGLAWCREYDVQALSIGMVLQQLGMIDARTIDAIMAHSANDPLGDLLGQQLVERGHISLEQLHEALRTQMIWTVCEMALWTRGTYNFTRGAASPLRSSVPGTTAISRYEAPPVEAARVTIEIVRFQYEWNDLRQWLPNGMRTELRMAPTPPEDHKLIFPAPIWRLITRVNAYHTPRRIATALQTPEQEIARMLAPHVQDGVLTTIVNEHSMAFPALSRVLPPQNIDLFSLISQMLQEWLRRKTLVEQLTALGQFINWTMAELESEWNQYNRIPSPDSLASMLQRERCDRIGSYKLRVVSNRIDPEDLAVHLRAMAEQARRIGKLAEFAQDAFATLSQALVATFVAINRRIDSPEYRRQYETTWLMLFDEFRQNLQYTRV